MRAVILVLTLLAAPAAAPEINYDEAKVGAYRLPELLLAADGRKVADAAAWRARRRPEILRLFWEHVYGRTPAGRVAAHVTTTEIEPRALGGLATRKQITIRFGESAGGPHMDLLLYVPKAAVRPVPAFLGLNFTGNHTIAADPGIALTGQWVRAGPGVVDHHSTDATRGWDAASWQVEKVLARGYAVVTAYYGDLDPDFDDGFANGVHALFPRTQAGDQWGAIGAWAWGLSRALDYLQTDRDVDGARVAVHGHSRLGKAALWAGAQDERFALVIAGGSGEGGAALARRNFGETTEVLATRFPYWFCANFRKYSRQVAALPVDQHMLLALVAPRPLYIASGSEDRWADPRGEFLAAVAASPAWELFGENGLGTAQMPPADRPIGDRVGYHVHAGKHEVNAYDWARYLDFADRHLKKR